MTRVALGIEGIRGGYADTEIVHGITAFVNGGEALGVFGRNGVGKTTLARIVVGELPATSGRVLLGGRDVTSCRQHSRRRGGLSYMPQIGMVFDGLSVRENLSLARSGTSPEEYFDMFPRLAERQGQLAGSMSGGERKILSFVRTMLEDSSVVVLDEPSEGVQLENIERMQACIERKKADGCAFVLVEQNLAMLMSVCDGFLGLDSGDTVFHRAAKDCDREDMVAVLSI